MRLPRQQRSSEARRLGFTTLVDSNSAHFPDAMRTAFATAETMQADVPQF
ncbi:MULTISPECIES: hypothetical protein [unclassified Salinibacterium]|nr:MULTISPECIES: hypothetical protein [unclassified Salinibacterium]